jgi:hypothetical protein
MTLRPLLTAIGLCTLVLCGLLYFYAPAVPHSVTGWMALVALGLPVWFLVEWLGERTLGSSFFSRRSSTARILLGVPVAIALMVVAVLLVRLVQFAITAG